MIYIVQRERCVESDGYYYTTENDICGVYEDEESACKCLRDIVTETHSETDPPSYGKYKTIHGINYDTEVVYEPDSEHWDKFWVESYVPGWRTSKYFRKRMNINASENT